MEITERLVESVKHFEGFADKAYLDVEIRRPDGSVVRIYAIGYGRTTDVKLSDTTTMEFEDQWLRAELVRIGKEIEELVKVPMKQGEFDAFVSLSYNVGLGAFRRSNLLKKFNAGDKKAHEEFDDIVYSQGKVLPGLVARRKREKDWFLKDV